MTVFKHYFKIVKKFLPIIMMYTVIFSFFAVMATADQQTNTFAEMKPQVAIINNDQTGELTTTFIKYVEQNSDIVEVGSTEDEISDSLFYREIDYIMVIPNGYTEEFLKGNDIKIETRRIPDSYTSTYAEMLYNRFWNIAKLYSRIGMDEEEIASVILDDLKEDSKVSMLESNQSDLDRVNAFYNFTNYTILAILIFVVGILMAIFNETNIKKRNTVSPFSYKKLNVQLFLGNACITFFIWLLFAAISIGMYGEVMFTNNGLLIMLNTFVFCITALAMAFLVGNLVKNKEAQNGIVNVLALGSSFICGAFVPQELLGSFVLGIARIFPSYWFIKNNNDIIKISNFDMESLQPIFINMAIVLAFAVGFFVLTNIVNKLKLKRA